MTPPTPLTITPGLVADPLAEGERMPVYVHVIDRRGARVLVDTGITELHPGGGRPRSPPPSIEQPEVRPSPASTSLSTHTCTSTLRRQPPLRRQADLCPASGARRRAQRGRLHHSRVGRGARRAVRVGRPRTRPASRAPARPAPADTRGNRQTFPPKKSLAVRVSTASQADGDDEIGRHQLLGDPS